MPAGTPARRALQHCSTRLLPAPPLLQLPALPAHSVHLGHPQATPRVLTEAYSDVCCCCCCSGGSPALTPDPSCQLLCLGHTVASYYYLQLLLPPAAALHLSPTPLHRGTACPAPPGAAAPASLSPHSSSLAAASFLAFFFFFLLLRFFFLAAASSSACAASAAPGRISHKSWSTRAGQQGYRSCAAAARLSAAVLQGCDASGMQQDVLHAHGTTCPRA